LAAHGIVADERRDVEGDFGAGDGVEELGDVKFRAAAVTGDDGRHAHADEIFRDGQLCDVFGVGVDVDEAGGDDAAGGVDLSAGRGAGGEFPESNDTIAADR
jgi:hypothetical protein